MCRGLDANILFDYAGVPTPTEGWFGREGDGQGCQGGHSGIRRSSASVPTPIRCFFRFLNAAPCEVPLASVDCGGLRNAIPREAEATVLVPTEELGTFTEALAAYKARSSWRSMRGIEDSIELFAEPCERPAEMLPRETAAALIRAVTACPDGVQKMSTAMSGAGPDLDEPGACGFGRPYGETAVPAAGVR